MTIWRSAMVFSTKCRAGLASSGHSLLLIKPTSACCLIELHPTRRFILILISVCLCSFAVVIQRLPVELRDSVCIFYLVLRALDTVEDDMAIPVDNKVPLLTNFHKKMYSR